VNDPERMSRCWSDNAASWTEAVRSGAIVSRRLGTDAAIIHAVLELRPGRVLDVGCGEGWLARRLTQAGVEVLGVDGSEELIHSARQAGGAEYLRMAYREIADGGLAGRRFDAVVLNFALLEEDHTPLLQSLGSLLSPAGRLLIQTVHPWAARGEGAYSDGWREESFADFPVPFPTAMRWYSRTLAGWFTLLRSSGLVVVALHEPSHPDRVEPLSLLLVASPASLSAEGR
jgi:2-polyprenyl-3-methyl-5-hydroxy-6-metoxy-1,4-benzoquinol methylase